MAYDIGPRIGIQGEAEFSRQIKNINNALRECGSEMKALSFEFENNANSQNALIAKNRNLQKEFDLQKQKLSLLQSQYDKQTEKLRDLAGALQRAKAEFGENSKEAGKAEKAFNKQADTVSELNVAMNETRGYMSRLDNEMKNNSKMLDEIDKGSRDAASGVDKLGNQVKDTSKKMKDGKNDLELYKKGLSGIGGALVSAGKGVVTVGGIVGGSAVAGVAAINSLNEATEELRRDLSKLDQNARESGAGIDEVREAFSEFNIVSGETDSSVEATSNLLQAGFTESNLQKAVEGLSGAYLRFPDTLKIESLADSLQETLATGEATGQFGEMLDRLGIGAENFTNELSGISGEAERQNYALRVLAEAGLMETYNAWKKNNDEMVANKKANEEYQQSLAELSEKLLPISTHATESMTGMIDAISNAFDYLTGIFEQVTSGDMSISDAFMKIIGDASGIIQNFIAGIKEKIPLIIETGKEVIGNFLNSITENIPSIISKGLEVLHSFSSGLRENVGTLVDNGIKFILKIVDGIVEALPNLIAKAPEIISNFAGVINDNMPKILSAGMQIIVKLVMGLVKNIPVLIENAPKIIKAIVDVITAFDWLGLGSKIIKGLINGIKSMGSALKGAVTNGFSGAIKFITSLPGKALSWGKDFINGLKNGIMSRVNAIVNAVKNVANRIRSFLHFSRPDEGPLRDYETWMPDFMTGLADGIYRNIDKIEKAASDVSGTINSTITGRVADIASNTPTLGGGMIVVDGDTIVLDGKAIGKSATKYISNTQIAGQRSKGSRVVYA